MSSDYNDTFTEPETVPSRSWPCLRQFCVFLENQVGRLNELIRQLEDLDTELIAIGFVDSVDFAAVRLMFNNSDRAREKLCLLGVHFTESDVVGVELPDEPAPFTDLLTTLAKAELNVHHMYPLLYRRMGHRVIAIYVDDIDFTLQVLKDAGHTIVTESDILMDDEL